MSTDDREPGDGQAEQNAAAANLQLEPTLTAEAARSLNISDVPVAMVKEPDRAAQPADDEAPPRLPFPVIGIGGSAGGLEAFTEFFRAMPGNSGMAFVLVQHLPPERDSMVAEILSRHTTMPVRQVEDGMAVEVESVYVIRPGRTLTIKNGRLHLGEPVERPGHRKPVDDFFRSLAEEQRERAVCIIMSGMGSNGTAGAQSVKAIGGICVAQDPESAKFSSMPRSLIDSGMADYVLRPEQMPEVLMRYASHPYAQRSTSAQAILSQERQAFAEILAVLRTRTGREFSGYKKATVLRRIQRRMGLSQLTRLGEYGKLLRQNPSEVSSLADDLVIHVTGFFRDSASWEALRQQVIGPLVNDREADSSIRAWVTACSTGEEAYSLAILLVEAVEAANKPIDIKIFATDLADRTLAQARNGFYPSGIEGELSPERLERFFDKEDSNYRIKKNIRELVVFAPQNVMQDPPFSRIDICTCRNLLIYLEPDVQKRVLGLLHFGLREGGTLFLGSSETVAGVEDLFEPIDKKSRIFRRVGPTRHGTVDFPVVKNANPPENTVEDLSGSRQLLRSSIAHITQRALLEWFTPAAVVVDRQHRAVYFHGDTSPYIVQPAGEPTRELLLMARDSIRGAVRIALQRAVTTGEAATVRDGFIDSPEGRLRAAVTVSPLPAKTGAGYYLVSFDRYVEPAPAAAPVDGGNSGNGSEDKRIIIEELQRVRSELQSAVEELQTSNEELKASNEEVTSVNEELQSTNEELETSKEELQSLNEELTTVNAQLQAKMDELEATTNDLSSLLSSTDIAVIFLDRQFRIRRFTPAARDLVELIPSDIGRPLKDMACKFVDEDLTVDSSEVLDKLIPREKEVASSSGRWYVRRILPYRTADNRIDGLVITFVDISRRRQAEMSQRESEENYRLIVQGVKEYAIVMLDPQGRFATWNAGALHVLGYTQAEAIGKPLETIFTPEDRAAGVPKADLQMARETGESTYERWYIRKDGTKWWGSVTMTALYDGEQKLRGFAKVLRDNTDRKLADEKLRSATRAAEQANEAKDQFLAIVSHELRTPLSAILLWSKMIGSSEVDSARFREGIEAIHQSADAQKQLIDDLLDTSRISSGALRIDLREIDPVEAIRAALDTTHPAAKVKNLKVTESFDPAVGVVLADFDRLRQIAWNLLANAVKFTPAGGHIDVKLLRKNDGIELEVTDTGQGIDPAFLPHVFSRFAQAANPHTRSSGGLGLGLTIAKQLAELHGGAITASSPGLGKGATFVVRLPLPKIHSRSKTHIPRAARHGSASRLNGVHILLVEDNPSTNAALAATLRQAKSRVTAVHSAAEAIASFKEHRPDLILSDIAMPEKDGYTMIQQIRAWEAQEKSKPVPAVAISAFTREEDKKRALASGFQIHLSKPVEAGQLLSALTDLLESK